MTDTTFFGRVRTSQPTDLDTTCNNNAAGYGRQGTISNPFIGVQTLESDVSIGGCFRAFVEIDLTSIPSTATVFGMNYSGVSNIGFTVGGAFPCDVKHMSTQPSEAPHFHASALALWSDIDDGTVYGTFGKPFCDDPDDDSPFLLDFNVNGTGQIITDLQTAVTAGQTWFAFGYVFEPEIRNPTNREEVDHDGVRPQLYISWIDDTPDSVQDLVARLPVGGTAVELSWTEPDLGDNATTLEGYQLNFTTPQQPPLTIITNRTTDTEVTVTGLASSTPYSFRVGVYTLNPLVNQSNTTGNILNVTTKFLGNFTVGFFDLNATQFDARDIKYTRVDLNSTHTNLEVVYPNAFNLSCDFYYKLALSNTTFNNLSTVPEGSGEQKATFQFHDIQNDIIDVTCIDLNTNTTANYLLTQTNFELLTQFANFRSGVYGTQGQFGSIDMITLGAIIIAMIGFNRVNESVGAIFAVIILGMLSYFQIVIWQTFMFGTVAIVLMLVIASTRKH